jgi:choline monooxygenase
MATDQDLFDLERAGHCGKTLTCPHHNWAYNIDDALIGIPDKNRLYSPDFPMEDYGLVPVRIEVAWNELVFGYLSRKGRVRRVTRDA